MEPLNPFQTSPLQKSTKNLGHTIRRHEDFVNRTVDKEQIKWILKYSRIHFLLAISPSAHPALQIKPFFHEPAPICVDVCCLLRLLSRASGQED